MEKEFVPYELALKLKNIKFAENCFTFYSSSGKLITTFLDIKRGYLLEDLTNGILAPTFSQAFRWFRENHNLYYIIDKQGYWFYEIIIDEGFGDLTKDVIVFYDYKSYEEAELACLEKLIEIVESKIK